MSAEKRPNLELFWIMIFTIGSTMASLTFLYALGGASDIDNLQKMWLYLPLTMISILAFLTVNYLMRNGFFKDNPGYRGFEMMTFHAPERSFLGKRFKILQRPEALISIGLIIASVFGLMVHSSGTFAAGIPDYAEGSLEDGSGNKLAALGLAVEPAVTAETMFLNIVVLRFVQGLAFLGLYWRGANMKQALILAAVIGFLGATAFGFGYHQYRYATNEQSQLSILMQFSLYNGVAVLTGSGILSWMLHASGNLFFQAQQILSGAQAFQLSAGLFILGAIGVYLFIIRRWLNSLKGGGRG